MTLFAWALQRMRRRLQWNLTVDAARARVKSLEKMAPVHRADRAAAPSCFCPVCRYDYKAGDQHQIFIEGAQVCLVDDAKHQTIRLPEHVITVVETPTGVSARYIKAWEEWDAFSSPSTPAEAAALKHATNYLTDYGEQ